MFIEGVAIHAQAETAYGFLVSGHCINLTIFLMN